MTFPAYEEAAACFGLEAGCDVAPGAVGSSAGIGDTSPADYAEDLEVDPCVDLGARLADILGRLAVPGDSSSAACLVRVVGGPSVARGDTGEDRLGGVALRGAIWIDGKDPCPVAGDEERDDPSRSWLGMSRLHETNWR